MITINNKRYAKTDSEMVDSLFTGPTTCNGYYKVTKDGILLMDDQKCARVFIKRHVCSPFAVSVSRLENGRLRYMHALCTPDNRWCGMSDMDRKTAEQEMIAALVAA